MHGVTAAVNGEACMFIAGSGMGKSTHVRLRRELPRSRTFIANGHKPFVHIKEGQAVRMVHITKPVMSIMQEISTGCATAFFRANSQTTVSCANSHGFPVLAPSPPIHFQRE